MLSELIINNVASIIRVSIPVVVEVADTYLSVLEYTVILLRLSRHVDTTALALRLPLLNPPPVVTDRPLWVDSCGIIWCICSWGFPSWLGSYGTTC
jgi:hypothetical protein